MDARIQIATRFAVITAISLFLLSSPITTLAEEAASAQNAGAASGIKVERQLQLVERYFRWKPDIALVLTQALIGVSPDGVWGEETETALAGLLINYILIEESGSEGGIGRPSDTEQFLDWLAKSQYATVTGQN